MGPGVGDGGLVLVGDGFRVVAEGAAGVAGGATVASGGGAEVASGVFVACGEVQAANSNSMKATATASRAYSKNIIPPLAYLFLSRQSGAEGNHGGTRNFSKCGVKSLASTGAAVRGCRQKSLVQIMAARSSQAAKYDAARLA